MTDLKIVARRLRKDATGAERRLWSALRRRAVEGFRFRRQVHLQRFICDFVCLEARLIVEVDGATHSTDQENARDEARSVALQADGFELMRVTNDEVYRNLDAVLETIRSKLLERRPLGPERTRAPPPVPSPLVGEG
jgi:very-short-patch-repair endonuclease